MISYNPSCQHLKTHTRSVFIGKVGLRVTHFYVYGISLFIISCLHFSFSSTVILPHLNLDIHNTCMHLLLPTGSKHRDWSLKIENTSDSHMNSYLSRYGFLHCRWSVVSMTMDGFLPVPDHLPEILEKIGKLSKVNALTSHLCYWLSKSA